MTPNQIPPQITEFGVDMSPSAIMARLEMVGQLNELCRFLGSGIFVPNRDENAADGVDSGKASVVAESGPSNH